MSKVQKNKIKAQALEVIFDTHLDGKELLKELRKKKWGVYKAFVKLHDGDEDLPRPHTHLAVILGAKPENLTISDNAHKRYFMFQGITPLLVKPLGKGNTSPLKKLKRYVDYLVDGHDNGTFKDTWNYKYDHELLACKGTVSKGLLLLSRGQTFDQIYTLANWNFRADLALSKKKILLAYREHKRIMSKPTPKTLRPWQDEVVQRLKTQDDRKIMWIKDTTGNNGKTLLCKELALHHDACIFGNAKTKDIAYAYDDQEIVACNLTRTQASRVNYEALEALKDGLMFSGKYESTTKVFASPRLVVMSNNDPDFEAFSQDRWDYYTLEEGRLKKVEV